MDVRTLTTVPVPVTATDGSKQLLGRHCWVLAVSLANASATVAASVDLIDGSGTGGAILIPVRLAAAGSVLTTYGDGAVEFKGGCYFSVNAQNVIGSIVIGEQP